jgi:hypothetical protein
VLISSPLAFLELLLCFSRMNGCYSVYNPRSIDSQIGESSLCLLALFDKVLISLKIDFGWFEGPSVSSFCTAVVIFDECFVWRLRSSVNWFKKLWIVSVFMLSFTRSSCRSNEVWFLRRSLGSTISFCVAVANLGSCVRQVVGRLSVSLVLIELSLNECCLFWQGTSIPLLRRSDYLAITVLALASLWVLLRKRTIPLEALWHTSMVTYH